jgi:membrane protein
MATEDEQSGRERGRSAEQPRDIPRPGWRDIALRVKREVAEDDVSIVAGGVAFYGFLSIFPALGAVVSVYGLLADPANVSRQMDAVAHILPPQARTFLEQELTSLATGSPRGLSAGVIFSILLALWSANKGTKALITSLNIAFDERESRGFFKLNAVSLLMTIGALLVALVAIATVILLPAVLGLVGLSGASAFLVRWLRWPLLTVVILLGFAVVYRIGPARRSAKWRWVTPGSLLATGIWLGGSALFSFYVSNFGKYDKVYGSVGAVVILLTWFLLSAYAVILGAEFNAEVERQTSRDSTTGAPKPLGGRGAHSADTVGDTP